MGERELEAWARRQASALLAGCGDRWRHVRAVAATASQVGRLLLGEPDRALLVAAAFLHDIGYARPLTRSGFHALDGAEYLRGHGQERLASLVAHHSGARFEAEERGLAGQLAAFELEAGPVMDALDYADMTTGPSGEAVTFDDRIEEILRRYPADDPVYRAVTRARPVLRSAVDRTRGRLRDAGASHPM
jgi:putative nucleotidyltransferase with HDIG domain